MRCLLRPLLAISALFATYNPVASAQEPNAIHSPDRVERARRHASVATGDTARFAADQSVFDVSERLTVETLPRLEYPPVPAIESGGISFTFPPATPAGNYEVTLIGTVGLKRTAIESFTVTIEPLTVSRAAAATRPPVILLNGWQAICNNTASTLTASQETFGSLATLLQADGAPVLFFNNCSYGNITIDALGSKLGDYIASLRYSDGTSVDEVDLVGHSMGGLIARTYLAGMRASGQGWTFSPPAAHRVRKLIQIAAPNFGAAGGINLGIQASQMYPGSAFLWTLATWNQRLDDLRGVDAVAIVGNADDQGRSDGLVSVSSAALGFGRDSSRTRIVPFCHSDSSLLDCWSKGAIAKADQVASIVRQFLGGTDAWRSVGRSAAEDPFLSQYGGLYFGLESTVGQYYNDVAAAQWGTAALQNGGATNAVFWGDFYSGTGPITFRRISGATGSCGPITPTRGTYTLPRCKYGPLISSVLPLSSRQNALVVQSGTTVSLLGAGFGSSKCSACFVIAGGIVLQTGTWSDQSITAFLPSTFVGITTITVQATGGTDSINVMADPTPPGPVITSVGNGASFATVIQSNSWVTIKGNALASSTRLWESRDFVNGRLPTTLDGVRVTINGKPALVYYISPTQINALAPEDTATGTVQVVVTTPSGNSPAFPVSLQRSSPGWFTFDPGGGRYPAATTSDGRLLGPSGLFGSAAETRPAKPGEVIVVYGTGFGPTLPFGPVDQILASPLALADAITVTIGGANANVVFSGMTSNGLCQLNIVVPSLADGEHELLLTTSGRQTQRGVVIAVRR